jgi:hypothetical protein
MIATIYLKTLRWCFVNFLMGSLFLFFFLVANQLLSASFFLFALALDFAFFLLLFLLRLLFLLTCRALFLLLGDPSLFIGFTLFVSIFLLLSLCLLSCFFLFLLAHCFRLGFCLSHSLNLLCIILTFGAAFNAQNLIDVGSRINALRGSLEHRLQENVRLLWLVARHNLAWFYIKFFANDHLSQRDKLGQKVNLCVFFSNRLRVKLRTFK